MRMISLIFLLLFLDACAGFNWRRGLRAAGGAHGRTCKTVHNKQTDSYQTECEDY